MTNPAWGTKRLCPNCTSPFYDLGKAMPECPKCHHQFDPAVQLRARRRSARKEAAEEPGNRHEEDMQKPVPRRRARVGHELVPEEDDIEALGNDSGRGEVDDLEALEELSELDEIEENTLRNEDEADEDVIMEEFEQGDKTLVERIEDASPYEEDEETPPTRAVRSKKQKD